MDYRWSDLDGRSALVTRAAELAFSKGMIVVSSAGNEGDKEWTKITPPADGPNVLAVGSIDSAMRVSGFSSKGYTEDGRIKPDIMAVGYQTNIIRNDGKPGLGYGTSYAAPQVAGLAACLWQAMPEKTNLEIIESIRQSSNQSEFPDSISGYGIPNFMVALWLLNKLEEKMPDQKINVYPNPFEDQINLLAPGAVTQVNIYSLNGTLIHSSNRNWAKDETIIITPGEEISPGIYFLVIRTENNQFVSKLVRK